MPAETSPPPRTVRPGGAPQDRAQTAKMPTSPPGMRQRAVLELLGIPMMGLSIRAAADTVRNPEAISPYAMDVWTLATNAEPLAEAVAKIADAYPVLGTLLDRIGSVTPVMELATVGIAIGLQFAENHGKLPAGMQAASPSLIPREELARQIRDEANARKNGDG